MNLPSREECIKLLQKYEIFPNIMEHSLVVNKIAMFLAKKLKEKQININIDLIDRASLLHDIAKSNEIRSPDRKSGLLHAQMGYDILIKEGYPEIAEIIRKHVLSAVLEESIENWTWEEKIVQYADDRIDHNKIVSLYERFKALVERYSQFEGAGKQIIKSRKYVEVIEKEIFNIIGGSPDDLLKLNK
ncbi:MAG: HDIG domain-containing protein [Nanoarchaeota archaeon]|nr:HDIG domain-containing protein [Nanoarchaeota archaeon]